ncbi:MAG: hypothetical protein WCW84_06795 [Sulfurimonas sp.]|jgi:hypothetical protein
MNRVEYFAAMFATLSMTALVVVIGLDQAGIVDFSPARTTTARYGLIYDSELSREINATLQRNGDMLLGINNQYALIPGSCDETKIINNDKGNNIRKAFENRNSLSSEEDDSAKCIDTDGIKTRVFVYKKARANKGYGNVLDDVRNAVDYANKM